MEADWLLVVKHEHQRFSHSNHLARTDDLFLNVPLGVPRVSVQSHCWCSLIVHWGLLAIPLPNQLPATNPVPVDCTVAPLTYASQLDLEAWFLLVSQRLDPTVVPPADLWEVYLFHSTEIPTLSVPHFYLSSISLKHLELHCSLFRLQ